MIASVGKPRHTSTVFDGGDTALKRFLSIHMMLQNLCTIKFRNEHLWTITFLPEFCSYNLHTFVPIDRTALMNLQESR